MDRRILGGLALGLTTLAAVAGASVLGDSTRGMGSRGNTGGMDNPNQGMTWTSTNPYSYVNGYNAPPRQWSTNADLPPETPPRPWRGHAWRSHSTAVTDREATAQGVRWEKVAAIIAHNEAGRHRYSHARARTYAGWYTYTYYPETRVYYAPHRHGWYYRHHGRWEFSHKRPYRRFGQGVSVRLGYSTPMRADAWVSRHYAPKRVVSRTHHRDVKIGANSVKMPCGKDS
jgi:hypothetical protein